MDRTIQQNASSAEESASASEELNAQAEQMKTFIDARVALVDSGEQKGRFALFGKRRSRDPEEREGSGFPEPGRPRRSIAGLAPAFPLCKKMP